MERKEAMENQNRPSRPFRSPSSRPTRPQSSRPSKPIRAKPERVRRRSIVEEPEIPAEITGEELPRIENFQLQSLALENAEKVRKHLVALTLFLPSDPERAFKHGQAAAFRAGRIAIVRERAGIAGVESGHFEIAQKDLRAASRISGSPEILPYIARCEVGLGNPRKALEIAGSVDVKKLSSQAQVMMRIAAAQARIALGEHDAAVITLQCAELNVRDAQWSRSLHNEYAAALRAAGRVQEAEAFISKFAESFNPVQPN
ncbi:MAG: hypothetical protein RLZZ251_155 [Actinomycetota bacterium]